VNDAAGAKARDAVRHGRAGKPFGAQPVKQRASERLVTPRILFAREDPHQTLNAMSTRMISRRQSTTSPRSGAACPRAGRDDGLNQSLVACGVNDLHLWKLRRADVRPLLDCGGESFLCSLFDQFKNTEQSNELGDEAS
jgi:hypothetical protein